MIASKDGKTEKQYIDDLKKSMEDQHAVYSKYSVTLVTLEKGLPSIRCKLTMVISMKKNNSSSWWWNIDNNRNWVSWYQIGTCHLLFVALRGKKGKEGSQIKSQRTDLVGGPGRPFGGPDITQLSSMLDPLGD